jgi:hypothetical protein
MGIQVPPVGVPRVDSLAELLAIEAIRRLKARYFRCVDGKDWAGFGALFTDDVRFDITADVPGAVLQGPRAVVAAASEGLTGAVTVHHGHCPEIEILSADSARAVWAMEDRIWWQEGAVAPLAALHGFGHYHETYARIEGRWLIRTLKLTRLRVEHNARR